MFLKECRTGHLIEILSLQDLFNPCHTTIIGRYHAGEEMQDAGEFAKQGLVFPSNEALPKCWNDANYRAHGQAQS